jgi:hypothetical protein
METPGTRTTKTVTSVINGAMLYAGTFVTDRHSSDTDYIAVINTAVLYASAATSTLV